MLVLAALSKEGLRSRIHRLRLRAALRFVRKLTSQWEEATFISEEDKKRHLFKFLRAMRGIFLYEKSKDWSAALFTTVLMVVLLFGGTLALTLLPAGMTGSFSYRDPSIANQVLIMLLIIFPIILLMFVLPFLIETIMRPFWLQREKKKRSSIYGN